jgi:two-component system, NtrC family, response regulator AtoC
MKALSLASGGESILVVDDDPGVLRYMKSLLETERYQVELASSGSQAVQLLDRGLAPDLILVDMSMPAMNGAATIAACLKIRPYQKIIAFSCSSQPSMVVEALRLGAIDYLSKPFYKSDLEAVLRRCFSAADLGTAKEALPVENIDGRTIFVSSSREMRAIRSRISLVSKVDMPVLLLGESGVGKEVLARLIHKMSARSDRPFLKINCAAIPHDLLESELFGYEAGAFTGATKTKPGKFEDCDQGTILLDEIGEMSAPLQAKLLHVLQDGQFSRLGGRATIKADFRVLAATNIHIEKAMSAKTFREDLYYRLSAFTIEIPPLRERREEIPALLQHFLDRFSKKYSQPPPVCSSRLITACVAYHWPGNLRELENFANRYIVLRDESLVIAELKKKTRPEAAALDLDFTAFGPGAGLKSLVNRLKQTAEPKVIEEVLVATRWNCKLAASQLKISYKALLYKMKQYNISPGTSDETSLDLQLEPTCEDA